MLRYKKDSTNKDDDAVPLMKIEGDEDMEMHEEEIRKMDRRARALQTARQASQSNLKQFDTASPSDFGSIFYFKAVLTLLYATAGVVLLVLYLTSDTVRDFEFDMWFTSVDNDGPKLESASTYNVTVANSIACLIWAIAGAIELATWSSYKLRENKQRTDTVRWVADSLAEPILATSVVISFANLELFSTVAYFGLCHISIILGLVQEMTQQPKKVEGKYEFSSSALWYSGWVGVFQYVPIIVFLSYIGDPVDMQGVIWAALVVSLARSIIVGAVQYSYNMFLVAPSEGAVLFDHSASGVKNYVRYSNWVTVITGVGNLAVIFLLLAMVYGDNSYVDGAEKSEDACVNRDLVTKPLNGLGTQFDTAEVNCATILDALGCTNPEVLNPLYDCNLSPITVDNCFDMHRGIAFEFDTFQ